MESLLISAANMGVGALFGLIMFLIYRSDKQEAEKRLAALAVLREEQMKIDHARQETRIKDIGDAHAKRLEEIGESHSKRIDEIHRDHANEVRAIADSYSRATKDINDRFMAHSVSLVRAMEANTGAMMSMKQVIESTVGIVALKAQVEALLNGQR